MDAPVEKEFSSGVNYLEKDTLPDRLLQSTKREAIVRACREESVKQLIELATTRGGLLDDELRQSACTFNSHVLDFTLVTNIGPGPLLVGCEPFQTGLRQPEKSVQDCAVHPDEDQVQKDVDRAFVHYPKGKSEQQTSEFRADSIEASQTRSKKLIRKRCSS
jgi:TBC1 domain family member 20